MPMLYYLRFIKMPVKSCQSNGKPGFKWGNSGKCYTYTPGDKSSKEKARQKAIRQGRAIQVNKIYNALDNISTILKNLIS